jgi:TM2 domain-containing membrane protein YozV
MNHTKIAQQIAGLPPVATDTKQTTTSSTNSKASEFWTVFLLGLFLGVFGVHRFYARKFKSGIVQLLTFGGLGIWSFIDVITILLGKFKNSAGVVFRNPKPKVAWSIFVVICLLGMISAAGNSKTDNSTGSSYGSSGGSSHESARQLIKDKAKEEYAGKNVDIVVAGLPNDGEPLTDALIDGIQPRLIVIADSEFPSTRRASRKLKERLEEQKIPVIYTSDAGAVKISVTQTGWKARTMDGQEYPGK